MYGDIGQKSNTMFFSDKPADVNALMAQAATIFKATPSPLQKSSTDLGVSNSETMLDTSEFDVDDNDRSQNPADVTN